MLIGNIDGKLGRIPLWLALIKLTLVRHIGFELQICLIFSRGANGCVQWSVAAESMKDRLGKKGHRGYCKLLKQCCLYLLDTLTTASHDRQLFLRIFLTAGTLKLRFEPLMISSNVASSS